MTPAAVFDCMVFVQALANAKGPACACYELVRSGRLVLCVSPEILAEAADVLSRPKVRRKLPGLTDEAVEAFLRDVHARAAMLSEVPEAYRLERDPKDERYLNLAIASVASYLVSWDRDLLDLMNDEGFRQQFPWLTILEPPALLRLFSQAPPETPSE
ncbi:MAG TPA: putative toxin-antitoxin system toxin component, PIN family [Isosphaeraceae bacterium]|nr:putative toxin-antitoxin system toxin component, PIN family [Isosphaeraceae bacterium]